MLEGFGKWSLWHRGRVWRRLRLHVATLQTLASAVFRVASAAPLTAAATFASVTTAATALTTATAFTALAPFRARRALSALTRRTFAPWGTVAARRALTAAFAGGTLSPRRPALAAAGSFPPLGPLAPWAFPAVTRRTLRARFGAGLTVSAVVTPPGAWAFFLGKKVFLRANRRVSGRGGGFPPEHPFQTGREAPEQG